MSAKIVHGKLTIIESFINKLPLQGKGVYYLNIKVKYREWLKSDINVLPLHLFFDIRKKDKTFSFLQIKGHIAFL